MHRIGQVFNNITASYKFYWLIAILNRLQKNEGPKISFTHLVAQMIAEAWYPVHYFHLSFGKTDSLYREVINLQSVTGISIDDSKQDIAETLIGLSKTNPSVRKSLDVFKKNVPFRFLSPWIPYTSDNTVIEESLAYSNNCPYSIIKGEDDFHIRLHHLWKQYLIDNYQLLMSYSYWHLSKYMEKNNPNVPNISAKINRPEERNALTQQRAFWNEVIAAKPSMHCIYTGQTITVNGFDLDHFIPWSFVAHDKMWNLAPVNRLINISKSNKLPDIGIYLPKLAGIQQEAISIIYSQDPSNRLLEDYLCLGYSISELLGMSASNFTDLLSRTLSPSYHIAEKMGYERWVNGN